MTKIKQTSSNVNNWITRKEILLSLGIILLIFSDMRAGAGIFAWFAPVPFLIFVMLYGDWKNNLWLFVALTAGSILVLMKAASSPFAFSLSFALMSGSITGIRLFIAYIAWRKFYKQGNTLIAIIAFPSIMVSLEYFQAFYTPLGVWGSFSNTQLYNLPLLQTASLVGFLGITALISWGAVLLAMLIINGSIKRMKIHITIFIIVFTSLNLYGDLRLDRIPKGKHVVVAAVMSDYEFSGKLPDPQDKNVKNATKVLFKKTIKAAQRGASYIVWGEGSTLVSYKDEDTFIKNLCTIAKRHNISIIASYVVILPKEKQTKFLRMENKFTWITNNGTIAETYLKHHPVPGEGSVRGIAPLKTVKTVDGKMAGAICYDYDFPQLALTHSRIGSEMVFLPGLDWRGMLRRHTLMSRIRAIEGGFSLIRSANMASSMGFDGYGRIRSSMSYYENHDRIMIASLPTNRIQTIYSHIGNLLAYVAISVLLILLYGVIRNYQKNRGE